MVDVQDRNDAELERASEQYLHGAEGMPVQDDQDARVALSEESHDDVDNDELATELNHDTVQVAGGDFDVYTGGNIVNDVSPLEMDTLVRDAFDAGDIFETAGQVPPTDYEDASSLAEGVDPMFLVEASKKTGEKFF